MSVVAANVGGYPRVGDRPGQQKLWRAWGAFERGEMKEPELVRVQNEVVREVVEEQARAGADVVSDGRVRWLDPISHLMGKLGGVSLGALARYFDTSTHYRQPVVTGELGARGSLVTEELKLARAMSPRPVAAGLTGPLTLSRMSLLRGGAYENADRLFDALVPVFAGEIGRLAAAAEGAGGLGAADVVIEEPLLLREPQAFERVRDALEILAARRGALRLWLSLPFGDASGIADRLPGLPVDGVIVDVTASRRTLDALVLSAGGLNLGLGLVDARRVRMEAPGRIASQAEAVVRRSGAETILLLPSNSLEYLPRQAAYEKIQVLARARDLLTGSGRRRKEPAVRRGSSARRKRARAAARRRGGFRGKRR